MKMRIALNYGLTIVCLLFLACSGSRKELGVPLSFYLSDQENGSVTRVPTNAASLVVTQIEMVASEPAERRISIKLISADASALEKLTEVSAGKTIIIVQGTNILSASKLYQPLPAKAGISFRVEANHDVQKVWLELLKLSKQ